MNNQDLIFFFTLGALLCNVFLLVYINLYFEKIKELTILNFFIFCLIFWQSEELLLTLATTQEAYQRIDAIFCIGWMGIGPFLFHYVNILSRKKISELRLFYFLVYGPYFLFYLLYRLDFRPIEFSIHPYFSPFPILRADSFDSVMRTWLILMVFFSYIILIQSLIKLNKKSKEFKQLLFVFFGMSIPILFGIYSHFYLPIVKQSQDIPITTILISSIPIFMVIAHKKFGFFGLLDEIDIEEFFKNSDTFIILLSENNNILYANNAFKEVILNWEYNLTNFSDIIGEESKSEFRKMVSSVFANKKDTFKIQMVNQITGERFVCLTKISFMEVKPGVYKKLIVAEDISDFLAVENKFTQLYLDYKYLLEATNEAFFELIPTTGKINWNDTGDKLFVDIFKLSEISTLEELLKLISINEKNFLMSRLNVHLEVKSLDIFEHILKIESSELRTNYFLLKVKVFYGIGDYEIERVIGTIRDISIEKNYLLNLEAINEELRKINFNQAHLVRAPLANILGIVNLIKTMDLSVFDKDEFLIITDALEKSSENLDFVINDIVKNASKLLDKNKL